MVKKSVLLKISTDENEDTKEQTVASREKAIYGAIRKFFEVRRFFKVPSSKIFVQSESTERTSLLYATLDGDGGGACIVGQDARGAV
ncbi:hypothetical protein CEXT_569941 [Caerostris extrusa]|uniref:Uncharacterized protein n=1 Tax=Caerostris extrusa TaxID=172846 RepID=A0AAV4XLU5_CAEEX|nr:hypothetical protein CEXT_569941 [Caerostris extrusa]